MPQSSVARRLAQGEVQTSPTSEYTVGGASRAILSSISLHNAASADRVIEVWIVPTGESQTDSNKFLKTTLGAGMSYRESGIGQVLEPDDEVYIGADGADVAYHLSGALLTEV